MAKNRHYSKITLVATRLVLKCLKYRYTTHKFFGHIQD